MKKCNEFERPYVEMPIGSKGHIKCLRIYIKNQTEMLRKSIRERARKVLKSGSLLKQPDSLPYLYQWEYSLYILKESLTQEDPLAYLKACIVDLTTPLKHPVDLSRIEATKMAIGFFRWKCPFCGSVAIHTRVIRGCCLSCSGKGL